MQVLNQELNSLLQSEDWDAWSSTLANLYDLAEVQRLIAKHVDHNHISQPA